mmetsp:Transcript_32060/g.102032  ORF Transcript_32060/g.102032 Transcript_32060/m.102032 type:complete len:274 (-) Transcript_32060:79-900(-)
MGLAADGRPVVVGAHIVGNAHAFGHLLEVLLVLLDGGGDVVRHLALLGLHVRRELRRHHVLGRRLAGERGDGVVHGRLGELLVLLEGGAHVRRRALHHRGVELVVGRALHLHHGVEHLGVVGAVEGLLLVEKGGLVALHHGGVAVVDRVHLAEHLDLILRRGDVPLQPQHVLRLRLGDLVPLGLDAAHEALVDGRARLGVHRRHEEREAEKELRLLVGHEPVERNGRRREEHAHRHGHAPVIQAQRAQDTRELVVWVALGEVDVLRLLAQRRG